VRFVVRGFSQKREWNTRIFSPVTRYASIHIFISISLVMRWRIHHMDVKKTFLNGIIEEEVYIEKPHGFEVHGRESHVCRLKKSLYGLKQEPKHGIPGLMNTCRVWNLPRVR
jgi:hypothetical protein